MAEPLVVLGFIIASVLVIGLVVWNVIDVARRSEADFERVGHNRTLWLVLPVALMVVGLGWVVSLAYLVVVRPQFGTTASDPGPRHA